MRFRFMENRYIIIQKLRANNNLSVLVASGIISLTIPTWLQIYETFLFELKQNARSISIQATADNFNVSNSQVYKIIAYMEK